MATACSCILPPAMGRGNSHPLSVRAHDLAALVVLAVTVTEVVRSTFGLAPGPTAVGLVAVWLAQAVRRVRDWRRGDGPVRRFDTADAAQVATLACGLAPWLLLPILHGFYPEWPVWGGLAFPAWLRGVGAVIGVATALAWAAAQHTGGFATSSWVSTESFVTPLSTEAQLFMLAVLLASGSTLVACLAAYWLCVHGATWLVARRELHSRRVPSAVLEANW